ncbi:hypothetical protein VDGD_20105 [Verticillium dahliae]|nr:hypothetical protein VDGD_20105 [Verticillium dahliae]
MADQLNINGLNIGSTQEASGRSSYIPPHMRGKMGQAPPAAAAAPGAGGPPNVNGGLNNSAWAGSVLCSLHLITEFQC